MSSPSSRPLCPPCMPPHHPQRTPHSLSLYVTSVPGSVLWLLRFPDTAESNLRAVAGEAGVKPHRLKFTDVVPKDEHLKRGYLADLFLDTPSCSALTTGCDILWSGTPVLTLTGEKMCSRVGASLLGAVGFPELVSAMSGR